MQLDLQTKDEEGPILRASAKDYCENAIVNKSQAEAGFGSSQK